MGARSDRTPLLKLHSSCDVNLVAGFEVSTGNLTFVEQWATVQYQ